MESSGIGIALVGAGKAAESWFLPELSTARARVAVIASPRATAANGERHGLVPQPDLATGSSGWRMAVHRADVQAVIVTTPNHLHAEIALAALDADRHVLVEKPLCSNTQEARELCEAAERAHGLVAAVAYKHRYLPAYRRAKALIGETGLGKPRHARARMAHRGPRTWSPDSTWFFDRQLSAGGALLDLGVHKIDCCTWLLDDAVAAATADIATDVPLAVETEAMASFDLAGGCTLTLEASWTAEAPVDELLIEFERGWLLVEGKERLTWSANGNPPVIETHEAPKNRAGFATSGVTAAFLDAISGSGDARLPSFHVGANHVAAVEAAYASQGEKLWIPDDLR